MSDNWKHRNIGMQCQTCMWFADKVSGDNPTGCTDDLSIGRCRRRAPTMNGYPVVFQSDWCGDHKLDETKSIKPAKERR